MLNEMEEVGLFADYGCAGSRHRVNRISEVPGSVVVIVIELGNDSSVGLCPPQIEAFSKAEVRRGVHRRSTGIIDEGFDLGAIKTITMTDENEAAVDVYLILDGFDDVTKLMRAASSADHSNGGWCGRFPVGRLFEEATENSDATLVRSLRPTAALDAEPGHV